MKKNLGLFLLFVISYGLFGPATFSFAQGVFFNGPTNFAVGGHPVSVAVGDFNGDGKQDLAVLSGNISILLGNGDGSFSAARNFTAEQFLPKSVLVGDFNGDGKQDLVVLGEGNRRYFSLPMLSILMGNGDGSFSFPTSFYPGDPSESMAVGDFNRDGKLDLAVANWDLVNVGNVSILMGHGDGSFSGAMNFATGKEPKSVLVGDFNGDGKQDLAVANFSSSSVSILLGNGNGSFGAATNFAVGYPESVVVGDFNGDGKQDLAVVGSGGISILLGNGGGSFGVPTHVAAGSHPAVGDFNRDGKQDLAVVNNTGEVSILLGDGNGGFGAPTDFAAGDGPYSVAVGDFNEDGRPDLAVANYWGNNVSILLNVRGGGGVTVYLVAALLPSSRSVQVGVPATAFATIINTGEAIATGCSITPLTSVPASFVYQTTNPATNQITGTPNTPVDIGPGGAQSFVFAITPTAAIPSTDVQLSFDCTNTNPAPINTGLNTLLLSTSNTPVPDIVALAATTSNDGIVNVPGTNGTGAFAVATVNVGASGGITASADTGGASLPLNISLCQTNPATGQCISGIGPSVTTPIAANATPTFGIFVQGNGNVPFDPAANRVFVRFKDGGGVTRGSTSVAVKTQ